MELLVVGAGEMGRWLADTVLAHTEATVTFADRDRAVAISAATDRNAAVLEIPMAEGTNAETAKAEISTDDDHLSTAGDRSSESRDDTISIIDSDATFDVVCLAVPMSAVPTAVATYAPHARHAIIDISGEMTDAIGAMQTHAATIERASYHPLFAPPRVPGNVALVLDKPGPYVSTVTEAIEAGGNVVFETTPAEHDEAMATVQAGAHAAILAWRLAGEEVRTEFHTPVSAALDDVADTVTEGSPTVYAEIQRVFDGADDVADAAAAIAAADADTFVELYERARGVGVGRDRLD